MNKRYLSGVQPRKIRPGRVLVHNHVKPQPVLGLNGFRAWTQGLDKTLTVCHCDWAGVSFRSKFTTAWHGNGNQDDTVRAYLRDS